MPEFAVRIEQPCAAKMKNVNYMEMTRARRGEGVCHGKAQTRFS